MAQIRVLQDNNPQGGTIALGAYRQEVHHVGAVGMATLDVLAQQSPKEDVANQVEATLKHEFRHRESHQNALARGESGLIRGVLGESINHDLQEAMASQGTTEGVDTYDPERARATQFAARIGTTRSEVSRMLLAGREREIVEAALENNLVVEAA